MMQIKGTFNVFGYQTRELDLTPIIGVALIVFTLYLVGKTTMGV